MNITSYIEHCCGCGKCAVSCPKRAIHMTRDGHGFFYPTVNVKMCVDCSICVQECTFNRSIEFIPNEQSAYAVKHKNAAIRASSRSGGVFSELSGEVLRRGGAVYGCILKENNIEARHIRAINKEEAELFHGSKYIQSSIVDCYKLIRDDLKQGRWVLFSGTGCQVNAVRDYCSNVDCSRLFLVDIVCHGVPSPRVWKDYLNYVARKNHKAVKAADFRDKIRFGWAAHIETFTFQDGSTFSCDYFKELFYAHYILRDSCFDCPYKNLKRQGDITLADCWGIAQNEPEFDDDKGVSLVIINSNTGREFFDIAIPNIDYLKIDINNYLQVPLRENWPKPEDYDEFWKYYDNNRFEKVIKKYIPKKNDNFIKRIMEKCKKVSRRISVKRGF